MSLKSSFLSKVGVGGALGAGFGVALGIVAAIGVAVSLPVAGAMFASGLVTGGSFFAGVVGAVVGFAVMVPAAKVTFVGTTALSTVLGTTIGAATGLIGKASDSIKGLFTRTPKVEKKKKAVKTKPVAPKTEVPTPISELTIDREFSNNASKPSNDNATAAKPAAKPTSSPKF